MFRRSFLTLVILTIVFASDHVFSQVQQPDHKQTAKEALHKLAEGVKRIELENGLKVLFYPRHQSPIFAAQIWVKVGGVNEQIGSTGISHLFEHMAFKGTKTIGTKDYEKEKLLLAKLEEILNNFDTHNPKIEELQKEYQQVQKKLEEVSNSNEFSTLYQKRGAVGLNAGTSKDYTAYEVALPKVAFEFWCWLESDRLLNPVFREFYKEREVVMEERRMRTEDSPAGRAYEAMLATAYQAHPNRLPVVGWASDIKNLRVKQLEELYKTYYRPDNIVIAIVGDMQADEIQPLVEKYFGRLKRANDPLPQVRTIEPPQNGERRVTVYFDAEPVIFMAFHKPVFPNLDDMSFSILHSLLSQGRSSTLYKELVQKKRIALSIQTSEAPGELYPSLFYIYAAPAQGVSPEFLEAEIQKILDRYKNILVSNEELKAAKKRVRVGMLETLTSHSDLAGELAHAELLWGKWEVLFDMFDAIQNTTAEDIKQIANKYLEVEKRTTVISRKK